jgi:NADH-quinone oxidoreductase subunit M
MNAAGFPLLSLITFLPMVGVLVMMLIRGDDAVIAANARWTALWTSLITFALSLVLWSHFNPADPGFQFVEQADWLPAWGITYKMGVDGISVLFVLLSTLLTPVCILASWESIQSRVREYMIAFLVLETMLIGVFSSLDFVMFYMFFEGVLIPMYLIIGGWGGPRRVYAAVKFFLFTLAGSVILAGVLLKLGAYGFLRFSVPMLPLASAYFAPFIFTLSVVAIIYTSLVALAQTDMKKLVAYSSVAHMGVVTIGIFTINVQGLSGALMQMLSHGIVSAALFLCVGVVYDRIHSREIARYGGLAERMPAYAFAFMVFTMAGLGLPGSSGFVGEILVIVGAMQISFWLALLGGTGMILSAIYLLYLYRRVVFGALTKDDLKSILDLNAREIAIFAPLVILTIWMGIFPAHFTSFWDASVGAMVSHHQTAMLADQAVKLAGVMK